MKFSLLHQDGRARRGRNHIRQIVFFAERLHKPAYETQIERRDGKRNRAKAHKAHLLARRIPHYAFWRNAYCKRKPAALHSAHVRERQASANGR